MRIVRKFVRVTAIALVAVVALVAFGAGGFQLLVRQLPSYQDEIQAWVTAELGLALDYTRLDGAWGWRGPELAFRDVRVRTAGDATPFLTARGANVGFDVLDLGWRARDGPRGRRSTGSRSTAPSSRSSGPRRAPTACRERRP